MAKVICIVCELSVSKRKTIELNGEFSGKNYVGRACKHHLQARVIGKQMKNDQIFAREAHMNKTDRILSNMIKEQHRRRKAKAAELTATCPDFI